jgi:hypothetical protein
MFFSNDVVTRYNRTPGKLAAILGRKNREKKTSSHLTVRGLATSIETMPHERMYRGIVTPGGHKVTSHASARKFPPKEAHTGYTSHRSGSRERYALHESRDPGCTPAIDRNIPPIIFPLYSGKQLE